MGLISFKRAKKQLREKEPKTETFESKEKKVDVIEKKQEEETRPRRKRN